MLDLLFTWIICEAAAQRMADILSHTPDDMREMILHAMRVFAVYG